MPYSYLSSRGVTWHLFEGKTMTGKPMYFLSQEEASKSGIAIDKIPDGYEINEKPSGQVFCRKMLPKIISEDELAAIETDLKSRQLKNCVVERKGKDLIVHEGQGLDLRGALGKQFQENPWGFEKKTMHYRHYQPALRFQLTDGEGRTFFSESLVLHRFD